jgi:TRAP-type C4-dicarboxylate transport system substrate-binding protein
LRFLYVNANTIKLIKSGGYTMNKWIFLVIVFLVTVCTINACAQAPSTPVPSPTPKPAQTTPPAAEVKILKFAYDMPKTGGTAQGWNWFAEQVPIKTNGRYKVDVYPAGALFKSADAMNSIQAGIADFSNVAISANTKALPVNSLFYLPSVHFPNTKEGLAASRATGRELLTKYSVMSNEFKSFKLFSWNVGISSIVFTKRTKLSVPDDLKGLKIAAGGADQELVKLTGGTPVMIAPPDMYAGLDKGVVDGGVTGWVQIQSQRFDEVVNYFLDYGFGQNVQTVPMNLTTWNSLPPDIQQILTDLVPGMENVSANAMLGDDDKGRNLVNSNPSKTVVVPNAEQKQLWDALFAPMEAVWLENMKAKGVSEAPAILSYLKQKSSEAWAKSK